MITAGLAVSVQKIFFIGLQKDDFQAVAACFERIEDSGMMGDEVFFTGVHHKRQAGDVGIVLQGKFKKFRQQGDGHVVHAVETCVFHHVEGGAFARSGKTGNDENFFASHRYRIGRGVRILGLLL